MDVERKLGKFRTVSSTFCSLPTQEKAGLVESRSLERSQNVDEDNEITHSSESTTLKEDKTKSCVLRSTSQSHIEIKQESVNYLGYYSSHEQLMQELMFGHANATRRKIQDIVKQGNNGGQLSIMVFCFGYIVRYG